MICSSWAPDEVELGLLGGPAGWAPISPPNAGGSCKFPGNGDWFLLLLFVGWPPLKEKRENKSTLYLLIIYIRYANMLTTTQ